MYSWNKIGLYFMERASNMFIVFTCLDGYNNVTLSTKQNFQEMAWNCARMSAVESFQSNDIKI